MRSHFVNLWGNSCMRFAVLIQIKHAIRITFLYTWVLSCIMFVVERKGFMDISLIDKHKLSLCDLNLFVRPKSKKKFMFSALSAKLFYWQLFAHALVTESTDDKQDTFAASLPLSCFGIVWLAYWRPKPDSGFVTAFVSVMPFDLCFRSFFSTCYTYSIYEDIVLYVWPSLNCIVNQMLRQCFLFFYLHSSLALFHRLRVFYRPVETERYGKSDGLVSMNILFYVLTRIQRFDWT